MTCASPSALWPSCPSPPSPWGSSSGPGAQCLSAREGNTPSVEEMWGHSPDFASCWRRCGDITRFRQFFRRNRDCAPTSPRISSKGWRNRAVFPHSSTMRKLILLLVLSGTVLAAPPRPAPVIDQIRTDIARLSQRVTDKPKDLKAMAQLAEAYLREANSTGDSSGFIRAE